MRTSGAIAGGATLTRKTAGLFASDIHRRALRRVRTALQWLWYDRPVRTQLLIAVGAINLIAACIASAVSIYNTQTATRVEIEASLEVAQRFVSATMKELAADDQLDRLAEHLPQQLEHLRHVRIMLMDDSNQLTMVSPSTRRTAQWVPRWFSALVRPKLVDRSVRVVSSQSGPVVIIGEPADEIAEAWHDFYTLALVWLVLDVLILVLLYVVLGRILDPLASVTRGMLNLEDGDYTARLQPPKVKELAVLTNRFNMLAGGLDSAREENSRLYQRLISVQEQERRDIANELHDEAGPCLFGITANASSIKKLAGQIADKRTSEISGRVAEILTIADRLKLMNRALLKRLRPGPLGRVSLSQLLDELIAGFQRRHPDTQITASFGKLAKSYGEGIDLTLYRCIQEGITNAIRHGKAADLSIELAEESTLAHGAGKRTRSALHLTMRDDGKGFSSSAQRGFGLTTMTERVSSLGGSCLIESAPSKGTTIRIEFPVRLKPGERPRRRLELAGGMP